MNEYHFPGFRDEPLRGEEMFWKVERVLFFGLMAVGFLADIVQLRIDRSKAYLFLFLSLFLGGLSSTFGAYQFRFVSGLFRALGNLTGG